MNTSLSLKEKIGQLFIIAVQKDELDEELKKAISHYNIGGVILFQRNLRNFSKIIHFIKDIQAYAKGSGRPPLWISIDQEGGGISYLWENMAVSPGNMLLGATNTPEKSYIAHYHMGRQLRSIGFNMDFSPVLDINNNPENPVIGARSFGEREELVTKMGMEAIKGLHDAGVMACGKHYPGHGDTEFDSHLSLPTINKSIEELDQFELVPFHKSMKNGLEAIMTAHIVYPHVDPDKPATLSNEFLTEILRKGVGYEGLIITDSMEMEAISRFFGREKGTVMALQAGADIILACGQSYENQFKMIDAAVDAVEGGELDPSLINTAYKRNLKYKSKWVKPDFNSTVEDIIVYCNDDSIHQLMEEIACEGITVIQDDRRLIPIPPAKCTLIYQKTLNDENYMGDRKNPCPATFTEEHYQLIALENNVPTSKDTTEMVDRILPNEQVILFINERRNLREEWNSLIGEISKLTKNIIVVSLWNPQIYKEISDKEITYIACYSNTSHVIQGLKKIIEGKVEPKGTPPVTILKQGSQSL
ncbi:beta-N-acetylhexosaminidase [Evansella vedderi]|uniref:Beta-N-acetylhexosaminidase n=1 Tax=Evansella vedderi TaxID=38282 RepID=A0ABT9ZP55_9BACI|nr:beta-N-acetylhexosaminidase [Evansella vedderi]MDQ0253018.1 beta-N-acetylhexosaminidase [Evansella vedderi]